VLQNEYLDGCVDGVCTATRRSLPAAGRFASRWSAEQVGIRSVLLLFSHKVALNLSNYCYERHIRCRHMLWSVRHVLMLYLNGQNRYQVVAQGL